MCFCSIQYYTSSQSNKQLKWSKERLKLDLFDAILKQKCYDCETLTIKKGKKLPEIIIKPQKMIHTEILHAEYRRKQEPMMNTQSLTEKPRQQMTNTFLCLVNICCTSDCGSQ